MNFEISWFFNPPVTKWPSLVFCLELIRSLPYDARLDVNIFMLLLIHSRHVDNLLILLMFSEYNTGMCKLLCLESVLMFGLK